MSRRKNSKLPFDARGGVIAFPARMIRSDEYLSLSAHSKALILLLQTHWKNADVHYGLREAMEKIPCSKQTAKKAFDELMEKGFISCTGPAIFNSRTGSKARSWRLEWMPYYDKTPTKKWEKTKPKLALKN